MQHSLHIAMAQLNLTVGALEENSRKILEAHARAEAEGADLVMFTELAICGYPPEDLVLAPAFQRASEAAVEDIAIKTQESDTALLLGAPVSMGGKLYNAVHLIDKGEVLYTQMKYDLPNYGVFDEKRIFHPGPLPSPYTWRGIKLGLIICEDMWSDDVPGAMADADILLSINASPFETGKHAMRLARARHAVGVTGKPVIYMNQICGQDDLVFDGDSFVMSRDQKLQWRLSRTEEDFAVINILKEDGHWHVTPGRIEAYESNEEVMYLAMMLGLRDYVTKNGFSSLVIGMSGGIDSALTAAVAVDALGSERVHLIMMPSRYTSDDSLHHAEECSKRLGVIMETVPIEAIIESCHNVLKPHFANKPVDLTEENLQSRIRGTLLMALSNKHGHLVIATGNKSEMSVGYATLYGDMNGSYSVLKDAYKTQVYALARWRNTHRPHGGHGAKGEVIPEAIITKAPTAELRENQKDEDSLPPYEMLDQILHYMVEEQYGIRRTEEATGFDREMVSDVYKLLHGAEYKRRQSPPGVKLSKRPFGRDRRYPITNHFNGM